MKRPIIVLLAVFAIAFAGGSAVLAASPQAGQCEGYNDPANTKVDTDDGTIVLEAGLTVCIHASNGNTGSFVTDGTSTLADYIEASGLLNEGGQVPGVSNYVIYGVAPSTPPSEEPSTPPSEEPTPTPTPEVTPTPTPEVTPTPTPEVTPTPKPTEQPTVAPTPKPTEEPLPATDTVSSDSGGPGSTLIGLFVAALVGSVLILGSTALLDGHLQRRRQ